MSKLAHSDERGMTLISVRAALDEGNEDCVGLVMLRSPMCEHADKEMRCRNRAQYHTTGVGQNFLLCRYHAEQWACEQE